MKKKIKTKKEIDVVELLNYSANHRKEMWDNFNKEEKSYMFGEIIKYLSKK